MTNEDLTDEVFALNSIYDADCIVPLSPSSSSYILTLPAPSSASITLTFPSSYPLSPPSITGCTGVLGGTGLVQGLLERTWREGEVCLYDLVEGLQRVLNATSSPPPPSPLALEETKKDQGAKPGGGGAQGEGELQVPVVHPWIVAEPIVEKKSVFVARAIAVTSVADAKRLVADLVAGDKKVAKATHNISAYRIRDSKRGLTFQDNDDDGETAAGGRLAHLLQVMGVWDVLVVVSRWYGGVKLGPDRFRLINAAAREALVMGGFVKGEDGEKKAQGKGQKGKHIKPA